MKTTIASRLPISRKAHQRYGASRLFGNVTIHAVLIIAAIIALFPIYLMFNASLKSSQELFQSIVAPPIAPRWSNFSLILVERGYYRNVINSFVLAASTTVISVVLSVLAGYGFATYRFFGKQVLFITVLIGLMVSETSVLIPVYNLLQDLDLLNTRVGLILPQVALGLAFGVFLMTTFFKEIPKSMLEAGIIDGCSDVQLLRYVIVPLSRPSIMSLGLIEFMWAWNSFFFPLVIATRQEVKPMSVSIIDFMGRFTFNYELVATTTVIMFAPILVVYLLTQRSFHQGITFGAIKE